MTLDLQIEQREGYLYLKFNEPIEMSEFRKTMDQIYSNLCEYEYSKVLLDFCDFDLTAFTVRKRIVAAMIMFDVFKYISNIKIAAYMNRNDYNGIIKKYANMNGFNLEMFFTENEAVEWLKKEP